MVRTSRRQDLVHRSRKSPWENGYIESFKGKLRDELLDREIFYTLGEAKILIERWQEEYNTFRPHSARDTALQHLKWSSGSPSRGEPPSPARSDEATTRDAQAPVLVAVFHYPRHLP